MNVKKIIKLILFLILSCFGSTLAYSVSPLSFSGRDTEVGYISQQAGSSSGNVNVRAIDLSDGTIYRTYNNIYSYTPGQLVNAFGYNSQDNYMYAIRQRRVDSTDPKYKYEYNVVLERIGKDPSNPSKLLVETLTGPLATARAGRIATFDNQFGKSYINTGAFDRAGNMYIIAGNQDRTYLYKINLTQNIPDNPGSTFLDQDYIVEEIKSNIPSTISLGDWGYNFSQNKLYFVNRDEEGSIYSMNPDGTGLQKLNTTKTPGIDFVGTDIVGVFFDNEDNLYIYNTKTGRTYIVNVTGDKIIKPYIDNLGPAGGGDGARNITAAVTPKPDVAVNKEFLTGEGLPVYDDTNKIVKLKYRVTIQNNNNLIHPSVNLTDVLQFTPTIDTTQIRFEAISLPPYATLDSVTGTVSGFEIPGVTSSTLGKVVIEFFVNIPYSLITEIDNDVLNTVVLKDSNGNNLGEDDATGEFTIKEVLFLDKERVGDVVYSENGDKATAVYKFTVENPMGLTHTKLSVKDLFVDKSSWQPTIDDILVDGQSLLPVDADGNVVISTAGIGPNTSSEIEITIVYDLTAMTTSEVTLYDFGQVTSYLSDPTNGTVSDPTDNVPTPLVRSAKVSITKARGEVDYTNPLLPTAQYTFVIKNETLVPIEGLTLRDKLTNISSLKANVDSVSSIAGNSVFLNETKDEIKIDGISIVGGGTSTQVVEVVYSVVEMTTINETVNNTAFVYSSATSTDIMATSNEIETPLVRTPAASIVKDALPVEYNEDGTATVTYTFKVTNETKIPYTKLTVVDEITVLDKLTVVKVEGGTYDATTKKIILTETIQNLAGLTSDDLVLKVTYNLDAMITEIETTKDKAYLYDTSVNPPGEKNPPIVETPEVPVEIKKSPTATIEKTKSEVVYNEDGTAEVIYTFKVKNTSLIPIDSVVLKDKITDLGDVKIISVEEVPNPLEARTLATGIEPLTIQGTLVYELATFPLPGGAEVTKSFKVTYNLEDMVTTSQTVKDIGTINIVGDENPLAESNEVDTVLEKSPLVSITKIPSAVKYNTDGTAEVIYKFDVKNETKIPYKALTVVDEIVTLGNITIESVDGGELVGNKVTLGTFDLAGEQLLPLTLTVIYNLDNMTTTIDTVTDKAVIYDGEKPVTETPVVEVPIEKTPELTIVKTAGPVKDNGDGTATVGYTFTVNNPTKIPTSITVVDKVLDLGNLTIVGATYNETPLTITNNIIQLPEVKDLVGSTGLVVEFTYDLAGMTTEIDSVTDRAYLYTNLQNPLPPGTDPEDPGQVNTPSEDVTVNVTKSPSATVTKTLGTVTYNNDGTADVVYTFVITNETKIPYPSLTLVDKIISLDNLKVLSVSEGVYSEANGTITLAPLTNFVNSVTKNVVVKYDLKGMTAQLETATDKGYLYDTSEGKEPGTGSETDKNIVANSDVVTVEFTQDPQLTIVKSASAPTYNNDGTATVKYTFTVNNPTKIATSVTVVDKVLDLGDLTILGATYNGTPLTITNNILQLPEYSDLVGSTDLVVEFTYDLAGMTTTVDSVSDKAYLYENIETPLQPGVDPETSDVPKIPSNEVVVEVTKSPSATIVKSKGDVVYNEDGTADVTYTFDIKNTTMIPLELELKDKITSLGKVKINSITDVTPSAPAGRAALEGRAIDIYTVVDLGTVSLAGEAEITKVYKINYNLEDMITTSQTVLDVGTINIVGDENSLVESNKVETVLEKSPSASITKVASTPVYGTDGTATVVYTFTVKNETKIPYNNLTVMDKIVSLGDLTISSVIGGNYNADTAEILLDTVVNLEGEQTIPLTLTVVYNLDGMTETVEIATDKAYLYGEEIDGENPPVAETPEVNVEFDKTASIQIVKELVSVEYDGVNKQANVKYQFKVTNLTNIPYIGVTVKDTLTDLGGLTVAKVSTGWMLSGNIVILNESFDVLGKAEVTKEIVVTYNMNGLTLDKTTVKDIGSLIYPENPNKNIDESDEVVVDLYKDTVSLREDVFNVTDNYSSLFSNLPTAAAKNANPLTVEPSSNLLYFATLENSNPATATNVTVSTDHTLVKDSAGADVFTTLALQGFVYSAADGALVEFKSTDLSAIEAKLEELGYVVDSISATEIKFSKVPGDTKLSLVLGATISSGATFTDNFAIENFASLNGDDPKALSGDDYELRRTVVLASLDKIPVEKTAGSLIYDPVTGIATVPYEIKFTNTGSVDLTGLTLEDVLTPGLSELGEVSDVVVTNGVVSGLTVSEITLKVGETWTMTFNLLVPYSKLEDGLKVTNEAILKKGSVELGKDTEIVDLEKPNLTLREDVFNVTDNYSSLFSNLPTAAEKNANPLTVEPSSNLLYFATLENSNPADATNVTVSTDHTLVKDSAGADVFTTLALQGFVYSGADGALVEFKSTDLSAIEAKLEELGYVVESISATEIKFSKVPGDTKLSLVLGATISSDATFTDNFAIENFASLNGDDPKSLSGDDYELRRAVVVASIDKIPVEKTAGTSIYDPETGIVTIPYEIKFTNSGTVALTGLTLEDVLTPGLSELGEVSDVVVTNGVVSGLTVSEITLAIGETWTMTFNLLVPYSKLEDGLKVTNEAILKKGSVELGKDTEIVDLEKPNLTLREDVFNVTDNYSSLFSNLPTAAEKNANPLTVEPSSNLLYFATLENSNAADATNVTVSTDHTLVKDSAGADVFTTLALQGFVYSGADGALVEFKSTDLSAIEAKLEELGYVVESISATEIKFSKVPGDTKLSLVLGATISSDATFTDNFAIENFASLNGDDPKSLSGDDYELRRAVVVASIDKIPVEKTAGTSIYDPETGIVTIPYEIKFTNSGTVALTGLTLEDVLTPGLSELGEVSDVVVTNGTVSGLTVSDITLAVGETWTMTFNLLVPESKLENGLTITNEAILKKGDVELGKDEVTVELEKPNVELRNDIFVVGTDVVSTVNTLPTAATKNSNPPVLTPGSDVLYFVTLGNTTDTLIKNIKVTNDHNELMDSSGSNPAFEAIDFVGIVITESDGTQTYLSESDIEKLAAFLKDKGYDVTAPQLRAMRATTSTGVATSSTSFAVVPANTYVTFVMNATLNSSGTFTQNYEVVNFASLNDDNPSETLTGDAYELRRTVLTVGLAGDLVLEKTAGKDEASVGKFVPYTIKVKNNSTATVADVYIKDAIPAGFTYVEGSAKLVDTLNNTSTKLEVSGTKEIVIGPIENIPAQGEVEVTYLLKVGVGVKPGKYTNTAEVVDENGNPLSNSDSADVDIVPDELFDTTTVIGKVFHDRDEDGIQDYAAARDVVIQINLKENSEVKGTSSAKQYGMSIPLKDANGYKIDVLEGRISEAESPLNHMITIRKEILRPDAVESIRVTTKDGTDITLLPEEAKFIENHKGDKKAGMTSQDIGVSQKITQNKKGQYFLEVYVVNNGIQEEGIAGVRLATVEGLVMETDKHGRYHLPPVTQEKGKNLIIKVDKATLPKGSVFTTENPRVRHLGRVMMKFNFGVKLPELQEVYEPMVPVVVGKEIIHK